MKTLVRSGNGGRAVGDDDPGHAQVAQSLGNDGFRRFVEMARRLVEEQDLRFAIEGAGQDDPLLLALPESVEPISPTRVSNPIGVRLMSARIAARAAHSSIQPASGRSSKLAMFSAMEPAKRPSFCITPAIRRR